MQSFMACLVVVACLVPALAFTEDATQKIAIIKADDVRKPTENWKRFFADSKGKGVKVSAGIICSSLEKEEKDYYDWLNELQASGSVEFWNHGWDHKRWETAEGKKISEFNASGYKHQKKHFEDSQAIMKRVLGSEPISFGTPYNALDQDTIKVMNENANLRLFFGYRAKGLKKAVLAPMEIRGEHDGTGKPNFEKFKTDYMKKKGNLAFMAIQFHPNNFSPEHFVEYSKILDFLISEGWIFMLPTEYISMLDKRK